MKVILWSFAIALSFPLGCLDMTVRLCPSLISKGINSLPIKPVHPVSSNLMISPIRSDQLRGILINLWSLSMKNICVMEFTIN